jgi:hypothetical protein
MQVDAAKRGKRCSHAMQFILQPRAFVLQLFDDSLNERFWHAAILAPQNSAGRYTSHRKPPFDEKRFPFSHEFHSESHAADQIKQIK